MIALLHILKWVVIGYLVLALVLFVFFEGIVDG